MSRELIGTRRISQGPQALMYWRSVTNQTLVASACCLQKNLRSCRAIMIHGTSDGCDLNSQMQLLWNKAHLHKKWDQGHLISGSASLGWRERSPPVFCIAENGKIQRMQWAPRVERSRWSGHVMKSCLQGLQKPCSAMSLENEWRLDTAVHLAR
jgi:hypothetical protein